MREGESACLEMMGSSGRVRWEEAKQQLEQQAVNCEQSPFLPITAVMLVERHLHSEDIMHFLNSTVVSHGRMRCDLLQQHRELRKR